MDIEIERERHVVLFLMNALADLPEEPLDLFTIDRLLGVVRMCKACAAGNHGSCPDIKRRAVPVEDRAPGAYDSCTCQHRGSGYGPGETPDE